MKTLKIAACLLLVGIVGNVVAQQSTSATKPATTAKAKKQSKTSKTAKGIDNKIAVSDQAQTSEKSNKKQPVKSSTGVSNK